jgi:hypothetical protein
MSNIGELVSRLVAQGIDVEEASEIVALAVAAGAASSAYRKSPGAIRTERWREKQGVTKRHKTSHGDARPEASQSVTERHKASQCDGASLSKSNKIDKKRERGTQLSDGWRPSDAAWRSAVDRVGEQRAEVELVKFRNHAADKGRVSKSWDAAFRNWIDRAIEYGGLPQPTQSVSDFVPDWDAQVARFLKGHPWSAKWYGPEPGMLGCRVPVEILKKHGVLSEDRKIFAA